MTSTRLVLLLLCATVSAAFTLAAPASAQGCSVCTPDGECQPVQTSGNCSCNIRHTDKGYRICRPSGICDLLDSRSCGGDGGPQPNGYRVAVDGAGLGRLEDQDSLVGTAIRASADLTFAPNGAPTGAYLAVGIHEGTLRNLEEESGYEFRVVVSQGEAGSLKLRGKLTSPDGKVVEFRANLLGGGRSGRVFIERDGRGQAPRTLTWTDEKAPQVN